MSNIEKLAHAPDHTTSTARTTRRAPSNLDGDDAALG
jgi:hypothetical protein